MPKFCTGQKVIMLTEKDGVYTVPCSINGIKRSLVFDTGASTVTISIELANLLYTSGKLQDVDIQGFGKSLTASGHIVDNMEIVLKDIEIEGFHLKNVDAVIIKGQNVPLLLGLSAIQKLGNVTLSGNKLIVNSSLLDNTQLQQAREQIHSFINNEKYIDAIGLLKKIENQDALEETDLFNLALCYCYTIDYNKTLIYCQQWMGAYNDISSTHHPDVCYYMALAYNGLKQYSDADSWFSQAISLVGIGPIERTGKNDALTLSYYYNQKAVNYLDAKAYDNCVEAFDIAAQYRMRYLGVTPEDLCAGKIKDERIGIWLQSISKIYAVFLPDGESANKYAVLAALCGNQEAIDYCEYFRLDYTPLK